MSEHIYSVYIFHTCTIVTFDSDRPSLFDNRDHRKVPIHCPLCVPSSSLWWAPASSFLAVFQRKLRKGDLLRERDFTLALLEGVAGLELEPAAGRIRMEANREGRKILGLHRSRMFKNRCFEWQSEIFIDIFLSFSTNEFE